jgi:hypothetical protein
MALLPMGVEFGCVKWLGLLGVIGMAVGGV